MGFNEAQMKAVKHGTGPMMVLAGPGSGKTTVIVGRIAHLIQEKQVNPSNILVITFTRAAAREMENRFLAAGKEQNNEKTQKGRVSFGTFHSVFFQMLKLAYRYTGKDIATEQLRTELVKALLEELALDQEEGELTASVLAEISKVKGEMIDLTHYYAGSCSGDLFKKIYAGYERGLKAKGLLDFDDMLILCYELLRGRPDILAAWQKKFTYILVDEFQDINRVQYEVLKMLAQPEDNLFIVGDDDQSIYRFRGAKPELMLGFPKDYPKAREVLLDVNYRSTPEIVHASLDLIAHNKVRYPKALKAHRQSGKPVVTRLLKDSLAQVEMICREIRDYLQAGYAYEDIAVLFRTNSGPRLLVEKLMEYHIPFQLRDNVPNLYEHWIARNILDYIMMARGHLERARVLSVMNRPLRYLSRDALEDPVVNWERVKAFYPDKLWMIERIEDLEFHLRQIKEMPPAKAVNYIRKAVGYNEFLQEYGEKRGIKPEELFEVADQLLESGAAYESMEEWFDHMEQYKQKLKEQAAGQPEKQEGVCLMTMHSAKGLEFKVVYILDANEGVTPHRKAFLSQDIEEERRMFYVAMTRAKERLHIYCVGERYHKKQDISRFVEEYLQKGG